MDSLAYCCSASPENDRKWHGHIFHKSIHFACVSALILTDGDDSDAWVLSATKWMEVKVQPGSYGVMLSVKWKDKHRHMGEGDERRQERLMESCDADRKFSKHKTLTEGEFLLDRETNIVAQKGFIDHVTVYL